MLLAVLAVCTEEELGPDSEETREVSEIGMTPSEIAQRRENIKAKIRTIGRMQRVFALLRFVFCILSACKSLLMSSEVRRPSARPNCMREKECHLEPRQLRVLVLWVYPATKSANTSRTSTTRTYLCYRLL
jgi:hypothetical protein